MGSMMMDMRKQAVTGVTPPQSGEASVRNVWPSVTTVPSVAALGQMLTRTIILRPLAWLLLAPIYFKKVLPFLATRYTLTNRRLMIQRGLKPKPTHQIDLADIDEVQVAAGSYNTFYRSATIEILSQGKVALTLPGVPAADSFRHAILNARDAWAPRKKEAAPQAS